MMPRYRRDPHGCYDLARRGLGAAFITFSVAACMLLGYIVGKLS